MDAKKKDGEVGAYQIKKIYVDDVNRICELEMSRVGVAWGPFTYEDRRIKHVSRFMVEIYLKHYAPIEAALYSPTIQHLETLARIHNGGPDGWKKDCTKPFWDKVKARMESVQELMVWEVEK